MGMDHPAFTLAALCSLGGIAGFARKRSVPSLAAGLGVGILYGISGYLLKENKDYGLETAVAASGLLLAGSLPRAIKLGKPVPVLLTAVGASSLGYYGYKYYLFNF